MKNIFLTISVICLSLNVYGKTIYVDKTSEMGQLMNQMDMVAARNGDTPSMARLAKDCFLKNDWECAYKWSSLALKGRYLKSVNKEDTFIKIRDLSKQNLTKLQINKIDSENQKLFQK